MMEGEKGGSIYPTPMVTRSLFLKCYATSYADLLAKKKKKNYNGIDLVILNTKCGSTYPTLPYYILSSKHLQRDSRWKLAKG